MVNDLSEREKRKYGTLITYLWALTILSPFVAMYASDYVKPSIEKLIKSTFL